MLNFELLDRFEVARFSLSQASLAPFSPGAEISQYSPDETDMPKFFWFLSFILVTNNQLARRPQHEDAEHSESSHIQDLHKYAE